MTEVPSQPQQVSKHAQLLPGLWKGGQFLLSRCDHVSALPQMCCRRRQGHADRHTDTALLSLCLPPLCSHLCVLQTGAAALRTVLPFTVIHGTRSSHRILSSFFFSPLPICTPWNSRGGARSSTEGERPKKKPEQLLQAELHLAGSSSSTRNRWASWSPKAIIAL